MIAAAFLAARILAVAELSFYFLVRFNVFVLHNRILVCQITVLEYNCW